MRPVEGRRQAGENDHVRPIEQPGIQQRAVKHLVPDPDIDEIRVEITRQIVWRHCPRNEPARRRR